jgi:hypothetical protein
MTIKERVARIMTMRSLLTRELSALQDACPHNDKTGKYGANTGNYDPSADCYWINVSCEDCGRTWTIYDDEDGYKGFNGKIIR